MDGHIQQLPGLRKLVALAGAALAGALLLPALAAADPQPVQPPVIAGMPLVPGPLAAPAKPAPQGLALLKAEPSAAPVGSAFRLAGAGLPASSDIDIVWGTANGSYLLNPLPDNVQWYGRQFDPISVVLAKGRTDASGQLKLDLKVPEDYGELHDIYAVVNGLQVAKGGFRTTRTITVTPLKGPVGTPITIKVTGLGAHPYLSTAAILYDNRYAGFVSATTTRGSAIVQIRAAGPAGKHMIEVAPASAAVPYLDIEQSAVSFVGKFRTKFVVTKDNGPPAASVDWPDRVKPTVATKTTLTASATAGVTADLSADSGPILSKVDLKAAGLDAGQPVELNWLTAVGTRARPSGWALTALPLGKASAGADGSLATALTIPDNLGGFHAVQVTQGGKVKAEIPYYVERSLIGITPTKVKSGQMFTIHLKGVGWTELDNGFAVTYDNGYIGYGCGFYSNGDVNMNMVATGGRGTHLIDLYPMIYKGKGSDTWLDQMPFLSFKQDAPGLALGYRIPAVHLAIEIVS